MINKEKEKNALIHILKSLIDDIESGDWEIDNGSIDMKNDLYTPFEPILLDGDLFSPKPILRGKNYEIKFYLKNVGGKSVL